MKKLTVFYLEYCPYCENAKRAYRELCAEEPAYAGVEAEWIEESEEALLASQYDYYFVPSLYLGREKLYEAHPGESYADCKARVRAALDRALAAEA